MLFFDFHLLLFSLSVYVFILFLLFIFLLRKFFIFWRRAFPPSFISGFMDIHIYSVYFYLCILRKLYVSCLILSPPCSFFFIIIFVFFFPLFYFGGKPAIFSPLPHSLSSLFLLFLSLPPLTCAFSSPRPQAPRHSTAFSLASSSPPSPFFLSAFSLFCFLFSRLIHFLSLYPFLSVSIFLSACLFVFVFP